MRLLLISAGVAYPVLVHFAVLTRSGALTAASLMVLALLVLLPRLAARSVFAWCALPVVAAALVLLARTNAAWLPLYATPVFINLFVAWVFGHTLAAGQVPLVERIARLLHGQEDLRPEIVRYTRKVTLAWAVLLTAMALLNLVLALLAVPDGILHWTGVQPPLTVSAATWSLFANFLNYLIAGGFFLAEYVYRQYRFPEQPYRNLVDFLRRSAAVGHRVMGPRRS